MKRLLTTVLLLFSCVVYAQEINVVPYPASVEIGQRRLLLNDKLSIAAQTAYLPLAELFSENLSSLTMLESRVTSKTSKGDIRFIENPSMAVDEYKIVVNEQGIEVSGCSYSELSMGGVTLLQMIESRIEGYSVAYCEIVDSPQMEYRGLMLDVARQKIDIETVKQSVNLCYWYKIKYLQIHLSDDQSFTFPSQTYPKLPTENRHYTHDELKELVEYAKLRGVIIIPEFDVPGHTTAMRNAMPELFGEGKNSVIDIASEQACQAVETIISEMMDVFYTSPYFHIGADECWFGEYAKLPHVQEYVKAKGYDSVHDIYLEFIVRLHNFVKEKGFKTMAWESFSGTGSDKVTIPDDLLMFAWETAYQTPQDLLKNGYQIINASWKPTYITPGMRWSQEYIYKWNVRRWENHWNVTPSYKNPINLPDNTGIQGGQMCAWEMNDAYKISSLHDRLPAFSETLWNDARRSSYDDFKKRYESCDDKFSVLCFPAYVTKSGFYKINDYGLDNFASNYFGDVAHIRVEPHSDNMYVTYTTDGSKPTTESARLEGKIELSSSCTIKYAIFDEHSTQLGYKSEEYYLNPIVAHNAGAIVDYRDRKSDRFIELFDGIISLTFDNLKEGSEIRYTLDGSNVTIDSPIYTTNISIPKTLTVKAQCFFNGKPFGKQYVCSYNQRNIETNMTTGALATTDSQLGEDHPSNAVDGMVDINCYWGAGSKAALILDLGQLQTFSKAKIYPFWDGSRYYQYSVEVSRDGDNWTRVVDRTQNTEIATEHGHSDSFTEISARYVRVNMLKNSANPAVHLVEVKLY